MNSFDSLKRITEEFKNLSSNPIINIGATVGLPKQDNFYKWKVTLMGPKDTPYEFGMFYIEVIFPKNYPNRPPEIHFITPIYHPNVNIQRSDKEALGNVHFSTIKFWNPSTTMRKVISDLYAIFFWANPKSPCSLKIAKEYKENRGLYEEKVIYFTKKYADVSKGLIYYENWDFSFDENINCRSPRIYSPIKHECNYDDDKIIDLKISAFGSDDQIIQCKRSEKTRYVIERFKVKYSIEIKMDSRKTLFIYNGKQISLDFTIGENGIDYFSYITIISDVVFG